MRNGLLVCLVGNGIEIENRYSCHYVKIIKSPLWKRASTFKLVLIRRIDSNIVTKYRLASKCIPRQHFTTWTLLFVQLKLTKADFNIPNNYWILLPIPKLEIEMSYVLVYATNPTKSMRGHEDNWTPAKILAVRKQ